MSSNQELESRQSRLVAFNAILTVPDSDPSSVTEFLSYINEEQFAPIARMNGFPVYRLEDFQKNHQCYMMNERTVVPTAGFRELEFSVFGSYLLFSGSSEKSSKLQGSFLVSQEIVNMVVEQSGKQPLTPAELRLSVQILSGMQLKDAANDDEVSLETKRSHMKSILAKLEIGRQQDLIRVLLPDLIRVTDPQAWNKQGQGLFNRYAQTFLPADVRCQRLTDREGRSVRIIEYGPLRGKPVLMLHSMIFPDITAEDVALAHKKGLRLIWPLRPGILEATPTPKSVQQYADETLCGIDLAWEHMCGEPVPVIAMVSSAWHAAAFAEANPEKVSAITFAATCFSAGKYENSLVYFGSSVAELCSRNVWLMTKTVDFIRDNVNDVDKFKATMLRVFRHSKPDIAALSREFGPPYKGERIKMVMIDSPESVKHDYFNQVHFRWSDITRLGVPVRFVHGAQDSIHKLKNVRSLVANLGDVDLVLLDNAGHILQYDHFHQLLNCSLGLDEAE